MSDMAPAENLEEALRLTLFSLFKQTPRNRAHPKVRYLS